MRELAEYLPRAASAKLLHRVVNRIPMAIHCPYPGTEAARPKGAVGRGLFLAGDWVDTGLPSCMESAALSGWRAAEAVLASEGTVRILGKTHEEMFGLAGLVEKGAHWLPNRVVRRAAARVRGR